MPAKFADPIIVRLFVDVIVTALPGLRGSEKDEISGITADRLNERVGEWGREVFRDLSADDEVVSTDIERDPEVAHENSLSRRIRRESQGSA